MKKNLIASAAVLAATAAAVYLLKRKKGTEPVADKNNHRVKGSKHRTEAFSKAKGFHNQHAMG